MVRGDTRATRSVFGTLALLLAAVFIAGSTAVVQAQAADPGADAIYETVPIDIRPGAVRIDWTVQRIDSAVGCTATARIRSVSVAQPIVTVYAIGLPGAGDVVKTGQTPLDGVGPGPYLIDLGGSGCSWTINIVAQ
jgi:hypothetical protein